MHAHTKAEGETFRDCAHLYGGGYMYGMRSGCMHILKLKVKLSEIVPTCMGEDTCTV
jgi:hypothetical protein